VAWYQKPGSKVGALKPFRSNFFRDGDLISLLGAEFVMLPLMNDDIVIARKDWQDPSLGVNEIASILLNKPVHGPALVAELQELEP
jgi:hypothetical protein